MYVQRGQLTCASSSSRFARHFTSLRSSCRPDAPSPPFSPPLELQRITLRAVRLALSPYRPRPSACRPGSSTTARAPRSTADMAAVAIPMSAQPLHDSPVIPSVSAPFKPALERTNSPPYSPLCWGHRGVSVQARVRLQVLTGPNALLVSVECRPRQHIPRTRSRPLRQIGRAHV